MDRHRSLYKENLSMISPGQKNRRQLQNANRAKSRRENYQSGRNIQISPTPRKVPKTKVPATEEKAIAKANITVVGDDKENREIATTSTVVKNEGTAESSQENANKSRIAMVATNKANATKAKKNELFLLRFIEWREAQKQKEQMKNEPKKRPFVPCGGVGGKTFDNAKARVKPAPTSVACRDVATFVPNDHHKHFKPPAGLNNPMAKMTPAAKNLFEKDRKSFYTSVPTPPRKNQEDAKRPAALNKTPAVSSLSRYNYTATPAKGALNKSTKPATASKLASNTNGKAQTSTTKTKTATKDSPAIVFKKNTFGRALTYPPQSTKTTAPASIGQQSATNKLNAIKSNICSTLKKNGTTAPKSQQQQQQQANTNHVVNGAHKFKQPSLITRKQPVARPKVTNTNAARTKPANAGITTGAAGKAHLLQNKRAAAAQAHPQRNAKFATSFKAKKTQTSTFSSNAAFHRSNAPCKINIQGKTLLRGGLRACATEAAFAIAETPTDLLNLNPYEPFITSTRVKSLSPHTSKALSISPIEAMEKVAATAAAKLQTKTNASAKSAKRKLLQPQSCSNGVDGGKTSNNGAVAAAAKPINQLENQKSRFNFVRNSVGLKELDTSDEGVKTIVDDGESDEDVDKEATLKQLTVVEVQQAKNMKAAAVARHESKAKRYAHKPQQQLQQKQKSVISNNKFNFIRHSVGLSEFETSGEDAEIAEEKEVEEKAEKKVDDNVKSLQPLTVGEVQAKDEKTKENLQIPAAFCEKTPTNDKERPVNYVGSFVSVSRGKVSARKERERRDSIYVPTAETTLLAPSQQQQQQQMHNAMHTTPNKASHSNSKNKLADGANATPISIEARRMMEAVRYFRQQLNSEIERLHALCDQWDEYKQANLSLLQKTGGEDMINVTVGQTKLLTSKKFQQFRGLIDRCEGGALGTAAVSDGSEATKPITDVDLEGFWSMLNLQVDNIEKRFENLTRWKANNWSDPEDVVTHAANKQSKPKAKPNLTKVVKKSKAAVAKPAKASSGLQAMLRKMHAEMRKNKENEAVTIATSTNNKGAEDVVILTPPNRRLRRSQSGTPKVVNAAASGSITEQQRNSTPRRVSVVVRDRKSLSAAATVISLPADNDVRTAVYAQRRLSRLASNSPKTLNSCGSELRKSLNTMERALINDCNDLRRVALTVNAGGCKVQAQAQAKAHAQRRRSATPTFIELPLDANVKQQHQETRELTPPPTAALERRKSILKTPGTKGKPKNVIFSEKIRMKKYKFTQDDDDGEEEEGKLQTSIEQPLDDQRTYSLRTRKVWLRPSSEFEIPKA